MRAEALLNETEKREIWHLRSEGLLPNQIAQAIGCSAPCVFKVMRLLRNLWVKQCDIAGLQIELPP